MEYTILVLEDNEQMYRRMLSMLVEQGIAQKIKTKITHTTCLVETKQLLRDKEFACASFDMVCPLYKDDQNSFQSNAGAQAARYNQRHLKIPYLIYSNQEVIESQKLLLAEGVIALPPILKKDFSVADTAWALAVLGLIPR